MVEHGSARSAPADSEFWREEFDGAFASIVRPLHERVWRTVFGAEYPEGLHHYSFLSRTELRRCADELRLAPGLTFADLGCGEGGPGLWIAAESGADLVGVDISEVALQRGPARPLAHWEQVGERISATASSPPPPSANPRWTPCSASTRCCSLRTNEPRSANYAGCCVRAVVWY